MKLSKVTTSIKSQRLVSAAVKYMLWQRLSSITATYPRLARAEMNAHKSETARKTVKKFEETRSEFWTIFAEAESRGIDYDITAELDRMTSTPRKAPPAEQIKQLAEATGLSAKTIEANMQEQRTKALGLAMETRKALEVTLYEGEFTNTEDDSIDPEVPAEQIDAQAEKLVLWLATWSKPDFGELMLIKADREMLNKLAEMEEVADTSEHYDGTPVAVTRGSLRAAFVEAGMGDDEAAMH